MGQKIDHEVRMLNRRTKGTYYTNPSNTKLYQIVGYKKSTRTVSTRLVIRKQSSPGLLSAIKSMIAIVKAEKGAKKHTKHIPWPEQIPRRK